MYHNIEKNHNKPGYHGWDLSGRFWKIHREGSVWFMTLRDGVSIRHASTLRGISKKLAGITTERGADGILNIKTEI